MFTQSCFIRNNTPELRKRLEDICIFHNDLDTDNYPWLISKDGMYMSIPEVYLSKIGLVVCGDIDCGNNERLFLALAALRDDTDKYQWFVSDEGTFRYCLDDIFDVGLANYTNYYITHWHKATPEELIEYFKK